MASKTKWTEGPWRFGPQEGYSELAKLQGRTLEPHEGYFRENNGDWVIGYKNEHGQGRIGTATFKGKAKRGEAWQAPDIEGQANARLIAKAPMLAEFLIAYGNRAELEERVKKYKCPVNTEQRYQYFILDIHEWLRSELEAE